MSLPTALLPMVPPHFTAELLNDFLMPDAVKDFLSKRKNYRRAANSKSGASANPSLVAPASTVWQGTCKECRTYCDQDITYSLTFKPCGTVEGTGSIPEGDFIVRGVYNMAKGTVAWHQSPSSTSPCEDESRLTSEFVGELTLACWPFQQPSIVGSFLTASGNYYSVELRDPEFKFQDDDKKHLPTLLTKGTCNTGKADASSRFVSKNASPSIVADKK
jgi:hypothetical protein